MPGDKPFVVTRKRTGIGSDLASAASGYSLALRTGRDLVIDWRYSLYLEESDNLFGRLFDVPESIGPCRIVVADRDLEPELHGRIFRFGKHDVDRLDEEVRCGGPSLAHHSIITTALRDPRHLDLQKTFLEALTPTLPITERIEAFHAAAMRDRIVAGIHIRHGNGENLLLDRNELFRRGLGEIFAKVHRFLRSVHPRPDRLLICSDSRLVREQFRDEFGDVIWFDADVGEPDEGQFHTPKRGIRGAEEAVIEMWLLARCDFLLFNPSWFNYYAQCVGSFEAEPLNLDDASTYGTEHALRRKVERSRHRRSAGPAATGLATSAVNRTGITGVAGVLLSVAGRLAGGVLDPLRFRRAEAAFLAGRYDTARARYRLVRRNPFLRERARLMDDWIRFHEGDFSTGWPRYPRAEFAAPTPRTPRSRTAGWRAEVADPRQPRELSADLGMRRWRGDEPPEGPLLVWFNFKDSLGGEILASRLVEPLRARHAVPLVLACATRLVGLMQSSFPRHAVVDKASDLVAATRECTQYVLARDLLGILVARDDDFRAVAVERLVPPLPPAYRERSADHRPSIALSWKTTNDAQGLYRNVPVNLLADVLARHDVVWHVAQHGDVEEDVATLRRLAPKAEIHADTLHPLANLATFATELLDMDAVLTADNTLLHLAGGLGIETLGMLSVPAYWAWPATGTESRWYDSVRLLRQDRPGRWQPMLAAVDAELERIAAYSRTSDVNLRSA